MRIFRDIARATRARLSASGKGHGLPAGRRPASRARSVAPFAFWTLCLLAGLSGPAFGAEADGKPDEKVVRCGYYDMGSLMNRDGQGQYHGYAIDYLREIALRMGVRLSFVPVDGWLDAIARLRDGSIDIMPGLSPQPPKIDHILRFQPGPDRPPLPGPDNIPQLAEIDRMRGFFVSSLSMGEDFGTLLVPSDRTSAYEDWASYDGMRIGLLRGAPKGEAFRRTCAHRGIRPNFITFHTLGDLVQALRDGFVDAVAVSRFVQPEGTRSIARFAPASLLVAVSLQRRDILDGMNRVMGDMSIAFPRFASYLRSVYVEPEGNDVLVLTREEQAYIDSRPVVRVAFDPSWRPLQYVDQDTMTFSGVVADLFAMWASCSGLRFEFRALPQGKALEAMKNGEIDVIASVAGSNIWASQYNMAISLAYLYAPAVLISRNGNVESLRRVAVQEGDVISEAAAQKKQYEILYCRTADECLQGLLAGKVDAIFSNAYVEGYWNSRHPELHCTSLNTATFGLRCGVSKNANPALLSILNRCIHKISEQTRDRLSLKHSSGSARMETREFLVNNIFWILSGLVAISAAILLLINRNHNLKLQTSRRIENLLNMDRITGLGTMAHFFEEGHKLLATNGDGSYALVFFDINDFKFINDYLGFSGGDRMLKALAKILQEDLGPDECCARSAPDHFLLLLRYDTWRNLHIRLRRILNAFQDLCTSRSLSAPIGLAGGICLLRKNEKRDLHRLLDLANYARHCAKERGRSLMVYNSRMRRNMLLQRELEQQLDKALRNGELEAWFQPKVDMRDHSLVGSEALVRWRHPTQGLLPPSVFVPIFERNGTISKVDFGIYEQVCRALREWQDRGLAVRPVSCNFSATSFARDSFVADVLRLADTYGVPHSLLELELTESSFVSNPQAVGKKIQQLRSLGFMVSLDDFGSGYSSLGQLVQIQADIIKIDRSFVQNGLQQRDELVLLGSVVSLAGTLGKQVLCEGVETRDQAEILVRLGCYFAQGFLYSRPLPRQEFDEILARGEVRIDDPATTKPGPRTA